MAIFFDLQALIFVVVLGICTTTYLRSYYPSLATRSSQELHKKCIYKLSVIGERCSPLVAVICLWMALWTLA